MEYLVTMQYIYNHRSVTALQPLDFILKAVGWHEISTIKPRSQARKVDLSSADQFDSGTSCQGELGREV